MADALAASARDASPALEAVQHMPRKMAAPAPNPNFSFPMMPLDQNDAKLGAMLTPPVRPAGRNRPTNINLDNVPSPWGLLPPSPAKPGSNSTSTQSSPTRGRSGHKRTGSEFVGADRAPDATTRTGTSPMKGDGSQSSVGRRRGHAHRRSGAISHHDLSMIINKPSTLEPLPTRPGSLPSTPTVPYHAPPLPHVASQPSLNSSQAERTPPATPKGSEIPANTSPPPSRPRVGFSDTVEFIPRPLSTISSETSSSMSTIRASHSVTGSITSIISNGTPSPSSARKSQYTADILERYRQDSTSAAASSPSPTPFKRRGSPPPTSSLNSTSPLADASEAPRAEVGSSPLDQTPPVLLEGFDESSTRKAELPLPTPPPSATEGIREFSRSTLPIQLERPHSSPETTKAAKPKKVKGWAGSILSRRVKGKPGSELGDAAAVSRDRFALMDDFSLDAVNFDDDNTCVIKSPDYAPPKSAGSSTASANPHEDDEPAHAEAALDLDATWEELDENEKASGFAAAKKRMHSGGALGAFTGPGMHYHRRAESAPALTPMDVTSTLRRPGSNSQMADVFEEEEEDDDADSNGGSWQPSPVMNMSPALHPLAEVASMTDSASVASYSTSGRPKADSLPAIASDVDSASQVSELLTPCDVPEIADGVEIVDTVDEPRFSVITKSSDESTITPTLATPSPFSEVVGPITGSGMTEAAMSTPMAMEETRAAVDAPTLRTATSSITDRSAWSSSQPQVGGPSSLCYSTEDVPSLTSSASTTFSGYHVQAQNLPVHGGRPTGERSFSFSGITPRLPRPVSAGKRASLASLSRLVSSSQAARSKLSLEVFSAAEQDEVEKKKRNRISRLMRFWKPKNKVDA